MQRTLVLALMDSVFGVLFVVMVVLFSHLAGAVPREKRRLLPFLYTAGFLAASVLLFYRDRYISDPQVTFVSVLLRSWWLYLAFLLGWCLCYVKEWRRGRRAAAAGDVRPGEGASPAGGPE
ncbi:MAG TPA: hypothetical protein VK689_04905 [Armatimonadota bacterium]|nr:hypothetical protein [Armatimonadota bacterium]